MRYSTVFTLHSESTAEWGCRLLEIQYFANAKAVELQNEPNNLTSLNTVGGCELQWPKPLLLYIDYGYSDKVIYNCETVMLYRIIDNKIYFRRILFNI